MLLPYHKAFIIFMLLISCKTTPLITITKIPASLEEASAIEKIKNSNILWTIEDAGNNNHIYGFNLKGELIKDIKITNSKNTDWEDLTSDDLGNLYIGDFGNNSKKRDNYSIYKVSRFDDDETSAKKIDFKLPKKMKAQDFEAFFLLNNDFYIFSKSNKETLVFKTPNNIGKHTAQLISKFKFDKNIKKITSAAISHDKKTIVLLNHDRLLKITNFNEDHFFEGDLEVLKFKHHSQKEGVCFKDHASVFITDERDKKEGGHLYEFHL
ncbi:hypothetical protein [Pseudotamlana carrageenivorans]|uniref:SdiA-regulated family protein n=1 Tax=Pseudotamlana carrageenivorans TaxID=2069432 RepID=A0A2I7SHZ5_9FLAO|nr:hypothetical protein [Tamlana carrageenivorans]AUS05510.1 hypothetical protein C1A40_08540 [Tamlana carrageenivorans]